MKLNTDQILNRDIEKLPSLQNALTNELESKRAQLKGLTMPYKTLVLLMCLSTSSLAFAKMGAGSGGGGSQCLLKLQSIKEVLIKAAPRIKSFQEANISSVDFSAKLAKTNFDIEKNLMLNNQIVDAINYPDELAPLVIIDQDRCDSLLANLDDGMAFVVHEVMGLMKKETREDYSISKNVLNELKDIVVKKSSFEWKYACSLRRWHYSGFAGFEYLGTTDSYGGNMQGPGYLYGRSDKDLNEYAVEFDISRGAYGEHEPRLMYAFYKDPKHKSENRQYLVPAWTEINFDKSGKVNVRLLGPESFPREGKETSSFLEMVCYRSM